MHARLQPLAFYFERPHPTRSQPDETRLLRSATSHFAWFRKTTFVFRLDRDNATRKMALLKEQTRRRMPPIASFSRARATCGERAFTFPKHKDGMHNVNEERLLCRSCTGPQAQQGRLCGDCCGAPDDFDSQMCNG